MYSGLQLAYSVVTSCITDSLGVKQQFVCLPSTSTDWLGVQQQFVCLPSTSADWLGVPQQFVCPPWTSTDWLGVLQQFVCPPWTSTDWLGVPQQFACLPSTNKYLKNQPSTQVLLEHLIEPTRLMHSIISNVGAANAVWCQQNTGFKTSPWKSFFSDSVQFSPLMTGSSGTHKGQFSRDPLQVFSAEGPCERFWHVRAGMPLSVCNVPKTKPLQPKQYSWTDSVWKYVALFMKYSRTFSHS